MVTVLGQKGKGERWSECGHGDSVPERMPRPWVPYPVLMGGKKSWDAPE